MSAETGSLETLEPRRVWGIFAGMAAVPRPSKREEKIRAHIHEVAKGFGLNAREEPVGNIIIDVPATPGHESAPITVLQGHLDMVAEKNAGTKHDFDRDAIRPLVATNAAGERIVRAEGTTLGADNGLGVALALAAATDPNVVHGPLELLFTTDEEAGMTGAKALTPDSFKGRRLLNLDSEEDDCVYIGCAGGCDTNLTWRLAAATGGAESCRVDVDGLRGGHSGGDIHENRGNAIKLLTRVLSRAPEATLRVGLISGGRVRNAIPREATAVMSGPVGTIAALKVAAQAVRDEGVAESYEEGLSIRVETLGASDAGVVANEADTARLLAALAAMPSGVVGMHPKIPTLVQTSNNLST
ncbi:MAG: M20/M25/M40 family metallo-hydrolase, partial [Phycisphaerae bacterium]